MENWFKNTRITLLFGTLWGVTELVCGYLLHLVTLPVAGALLMPVGILCMYYTFKQTGKIYHAVLVSVLAAGIKLITLFVIPAEAMHLVVNPVAAILLQGVCNMLPILCLQGIQEKSPLTHLYVSLAVFFPGILLYKLAFTLFQQLLHHLSAAPVLAGLNVWDESAYFFGETLVSTLVFGFMIYVTELKKKQRYPAHTQHSPHHLLPGNSAF
ncbi:MAG: hypothetical protein GX281_05660 [Bacteroidales bacterium]|nr:hypothetical protein [Bacteroidales bacterium]